MPRVIFLIASLTMAACSQTDDAPESSHIAFGSPERVNVTGYDDHIMEPFLSRDGQTLFFNNLNQAPTNTNLHYATRIDDLTFEYEGELDDANTEYLEGVATLDENQRMYFVSTRSYDLTFSSIYTGLYHDGHVTDIALLPELSRAQAGWVNFDVEVTRDGSKLYFVDGEYDANGGPYQADIVIATPLNGKFSRSADQSSLKYINTTALEYAACISSNELELYFTRVDAPLRASSITSIWVSTRDDVSRPFGKPYKIESITGFAEAPTLTPNDKHLYYHKWENDRFVLYRVSKI